MRGIVTMGGLMICLALLILIHGSVISEDIRSDETRKSLESAVEKSIQTPVNAEELIELSEENQKKCYQRMDDNSILEMRRNPYDYFVITGTEELGRTYVTGICYDKSMIQFLKKGSKYELRTEKGGNVLQFKIPLDELADTDLDNVMSKFTFSGGETILYVDELLYTSSNLFDKDSDTLLLKKNLLTEQETELLNYIYTELLNTINTDSTITLNLLYVDEEKHTLDIQVTEDFVYSNGRRGTVSTRKRVGYQL